MHLNPGLTRYLSRRGDVREEEDVTARFEHQGREEKRPDASEPGFSPGICKDAATSGRRKTSPRSFNTGKGRRSTRCVSVRHPGPV